MNKEQFASVLERQMQDKSNKEKIKAQKTPEYKAVLKEMKKLDRQLDKLRSKRDKLGRDQSWSERNAVINKFRQDWDEVGLILDPKKRITAKIKMLKKYKLYRG